MIKKFSLVVRYLTDNGGFERENIIIKAINECSAKHQFYHMGIGGIIESISEGEPILQTV